MQTVYTPTRANRLIPGASFAFRVRQERSCTVLQITDAWISYVTDGEEEVHYMLNDNQQVMLQVPLRPGDIWGRLLLRLGRFMRNIDEQHAELVRLLIQADFDTIWGVAIHRFLIAPEKTRMVQLLTQLSSQAKDQPQTMEAILGTTAMKRLLGYITPII